MDLQIVTIFYLCDKLLEALNLKTISTDADD